MESEKKLDGAFIGLVVIIIILVIGGIYIWQLRVKEMEKLKIQNAALIAEDSNTADQLGQDIKNTDTSVGVDVNTVK